MKYEAGRVPDPDRIFFDLPDTKLASVLVGKSFDVQDGFLKKIRVAQYQPGFHPRGAGSRRRLGLLGVPAA